MSEATNLPLPVFLISFNRGRMLLQSIDGIRKQRRDTIFIIQDNGSTDKETLEILDNLSLGGVEVHRGEKISTADDLNKIDLLVQDFFSKHPISHYIVSDCDVDLSIAAPDALDVYEELLDRDPELEAVGPMLRIRDISPTYPLYNQAMNRHIDQFWHKEPIIETCSRGEVAFIAAPFDTTLAMHRAGSSFARFRRGLRVYEPYEALHLDWYPSPDGSDSYRSTSNAAISHWNNAEYLTHFGGVDLIFHSFKTIRSLGGRLEIIEEFIS